jgi:tetratricopeptide (TPR) repeat protein
MPTRRTARYRDGSLLWGLLIGGLLLVGSVSGARAQPDSDAQRERFRRADAYLRAGKTEQAIDLLEQLYRASPENAAFYRKLKDAYESVKRYEKALRLLNERMGSSPTPSQLSERARLLYRDGQEEAAFTTWDTAVEQAPNRAATYRTVYQTLMDVRRFGRAIEVLEQGRRALDAPARFRREMGYLYALDGQHREAMHEYVALLANSTNQVGFVKGRLQTFVDQGEGSAAYIEVLRSAVQETPTERSYRDLLAWLYMQQNDYRAAYDSYRALDRMSDAQGRVLYQFAQKAADAEQFEVATSAFEAVLEQDPDAGVAPDARRALGDAYRRWARRDSPRSRARRPDTSDVQARYNAAVEAYRTFLRRHSTHDAVPVVLARLGGLQLDVYQAYEAADSTLNRVATEHPQTAAARQAQYDLGRLALQQGALDRAHVRFSRLVDQAEGERANRAQFQLAQIDFYRGQFDAAVTRVEAITKNAAADVTNDAIKLKVMIQEHEGPDSLDVPLQMYAQARLDERQQRYTDATARLDSLLRTHGRHALADNAQFRRAKVLLVAGDTSAALDAFQKLPQRHPRSPYADRSLYRLGRLHQAQDAPEAALNAYNRLLTAYPNSLLAGDVREHIRTLRRSG